MTRAPWRRLRSRDPLRELSPDEMWADAEADAEAEAEAEAEVVAVDAGIALPGVVGDWSSALRDNGSSVNAIRPDWNSIQIIFN